MTGQVIARYDPHPRNRRRTPPVRVIIRFAFAESPDVTAALAPLLDADPLHNKVMTSYFISRQTFVPGAGGLPAWRDHLFATMARNAESPILYFNLPANRVVEVDSQMNI